MIVLDASAAIDLLLGIQPNAGVIAEKISEPGQTLYSPMILDAEVLQVLRRFVLRKQVSPRRAQEALDDLLMMPITRYPYLSILQRVWELRSHISAFDAIYIALAETLNATILTSDQRLGRARGHAAPVEVVR